MPEKNTQYLPRHEILTYDEILRIARFCVQNGTRKIRLSGGETLVRKGIIHFIKKLSEIERLKEIYLITNGVLLKVHIHDLVRCNVGRINVSLDTLRPEKFERITRRAFFSRVWEGIEAAEYAGLASVKLDVVVIKGLNDDEIRDFASLTYVKPYHALSGRDKLSQKWSLRSEPL